MILSKKLVHKNKKKKNTTIFFIRPLLLRKEKVRLVDVIVLTAKDGQSFDPCEEDKDCHVAFFCDMMFNRCFRRSCLKDEQCPPKYYCGDGNCYHL